MLLFGDPIGCSSRVLLVRLRRMQVHPLPEALPFDSLHHHILPLRSLQLRQVLHQAMPQTGTQAVQGPRPVPPPHQRLLLLLVQRGQCVRGLPAAVGPERGLPGGHLDGAQVRRVAERGAGGQGADAAEWDSHQPADVLRWPRGGQEHHRQP